MVMQKQTTHTNSATFRMWFFNDSDGKWQGPFTDIQMKTWTAAGYFSPLLVVKPYDSNQLFSLIDVPIFAPALPKSVKKDSQDEKETDTSSKTPNNDNSSSEQTTSSTATTQNTNGESQWIFLDGEKKEQGPVPFSHIAQWIRSNYFGKDLLIRRDFETGFRVLGNVIDFAGEFARPNSGNASQQDEYVAHAHFDRRGRFKNSGLLDQFSQQGLSYDHEHNQLVKYFDVEGYQEALRKKKRKKPEAQLRSNYERHKRNMKAQTAQPKQKYYEQDEGGGDWRDKYERTH